MCYNTYAERLKAVKAFQEFCNALEIPASKIVNLLPGRFSGLEEEESMKLAAFIKEFHKSPTKP